MTEQLEHEGYPRVGDVVQIWERPNRRGKLLGRYRLLRTYSCIAGVEHWTGENVDNPDDILPDIALPTTR